MWFCTTVASLGWATGGGLGGRAFVVLGVGEVQEEEGEGWVGLWVR